MDKDAAYEGLDVTVREGGTGPGARERDPDAPEGYQDLVRIGTGGFATIYRARDGRFDRAVALKVLLPESLDARQQQRFRTECLATGRVSSHPNIVTVYDAGTTRGNRPWLAMEYCSGGSLASKVAAEGPLGVAEVIAIGARLCGALSAAHEAGILHRDVKPANVLLTSYGEPALADFGIASVFTVDGTGSVAPETAAYTVVHAAPEILQGRAGSPAADIYSLGSTLCTLLTGEAPFAKAASAGLAPLVGRILANDLPALAMPDVGVGVGLRAAVPPELERLLRSCMAAEPQDRPASAAELGVALTELGQRLSGGGTDEHPGAPRTRSRRRLLTGRVTIPGIALVALLGAFATWGPAHGPAASAPSRYSPRNVVVSPGRDRGELVVSWTMPTRPDVLATVVYEEGNARARALVSYNANPEAVPQTTLLGLASGRQVCVSAAHLVSRGDVVTRVPSRVVCAVPR
ncbi:MAG: serine/threonine-protein kinase [Dermatophilaceae bacterium]